MEQPVDIPAENDPNPTNVKRNAAGQRIYRYLFSNPEAADAEVLECDGIYEKELIVRNETYQYFCKYSSVAEYFGAYPPTGEHPQYLNHEIILGFQKQRPKFDIDGGNIELFDEILMKIECVFCEVFPLRPNFAICDSSNEEKFSRHIIITNYCFEDSTQAKLFTKRYVVPILEDNELAVFDADVNKKTQNFRILGSTKNGRTKRLITNHQPEDTIITNCKELPILPPIASDPPPIDVAQCIIGIGDILSAEDIKKWVAEQYHGVFRYYRTIGNRMEFLRKLAAHCQICDRLHMKDNVFVNVEESTISFHCRRDPEKSVIIWQRPPPAEANNACKLANIRNPNHNVWFADYLNYSGKLANYEEFRGYVRDTIAFIINGGSSLYLTKNKLGDDIEYKYNKLSALKAMKTLRYPNKNYNPQDHNSREESRSKMIDIITNMQTEIAYERVDFVPYFDAEPEIKIFNLFTGFKNQYSDAFEIDEGKFSLIRDHIFRILCNGDERAFDYFIGWLANIIQNPAKKSGVAVLLKSQFQGAGKNIVCDFIGKRVIGSRYYVVLNDIEQLIGRFNTCIENKILTVCDEIQNYGGAHKSNDKLKSLITQTELQVERKGIDIQKISDFNNYIFLTNNDWPIKVEAADRRYFTLEVSNEFANNRDYFDPLLAQMTDEAGLHFFHWLGRWDLTNWNPRDIPSTALRVELKMNSVPAPIRFLMDILKGEIAGIQLRDEEYVFPIHSSALFQQFIGWKTERQIIENFTDQRFTKEVNKIIDSSNLTIDGIRKKGYELKSGSILSGLRTFLKMPNLAIDNL